MDRLLLIDGNSIINRAYFAIPPLNTKSGRNVNAVYGFMNILLRAISDTEATHCIVAFDLRGKNFRKELYPEYKANRKGMPDDLAEQMPVLHELLEAMGVTICERAGVEADDIIGTLSVKAPMPSVILSGDRDLLQLVGEGVTVLLTKRGITDVEVNDARTMLDNYGLTPKQIIEYKALCGDSSDNIPGVAGIGDKGAKSLLAEYGDLDGIYANIEAVKGAMRKKLELGRDMAYLSKKLATIVTDADVSADFDKSRLKGVYSEAAREKLSELEFNAIIKRLSFEEASEEAIAVGSACISEERLRELLEGNDEAMALDVTEENDGFTVTIAFKEEEEYFVKVSGREELRSILSVALKGRKTLVYDRKEIIALSGVDVTAEDLSLMDYIVDYRPSQGKKEFFERYGAASRAAGLFGIYKSLSDKLKADGTERLYREIELPLSSVLYKMEENGVKVREEVIYELKERYEAEISELSEKVYEYAGESFNILSPKQLAEVLFVKMGLPHGKKTKTGFSTDAETMEKIAGEHPIVECVLRIRQLNKLKGTYIDGLTPFVRDGYVHTTFNQTQTVTGRLSSSEPNMQNIPVKTDDGKEIRRIFVSGNGLLVSADYSQIELRLLAHFSEDENLIAAFKNGEDIHALVASELFGVPRELVTGSMRRTAKAVNFGIIYGISDYGLSQSAHLTPANAKKYIERYFGSYPAIKAYLDGSVERAREQGFVTTVTGRRRMLPEINSKNFRLRSFAERAAMNMPLQGSAADIIKIAMINVDRAMRAADLKSKLILQVHDELIVDAYEEELEAVENILRREMENAVEARVPLTVNISYGRDMYEAK